MDLSRVAMVIGKDKLPVLGQARIAVVGLGGVGSYVAESTPIRHAASLHKGYLPAALIW